MKLSEDRISHIAHLILDGIWGDDLADFPEEGKALKGIKLSITDFLHHEDDADNTARKKIHSLSRDVPEGSREWEILYSQYLEEELAKKGASR